MRVRRLLNQLLVPLLACAVLMIGGCRKSTPPITAPKPPSGQTLRTLSFRHAFAPNTISRFEQATSSRIHLREYETNDELLGLLNKDEPADLIFPAGYTVELLLRTGRLRPLAQERIPNLSEVPVEFRSPPHDPGLRFCAPYDFSLVGLALLPSTQGVRHEPDSLATLFSPDGPPVAWLDDMRATLGMALRQLGRSANTQNALDLDEARNLLVKAAPRVVDLVADPERLLRGGRVKLALGRSTDLFRLTRDFNEVRFVVPREGVLLSVNYACVPTSAQHPELAFGFLDYLLSPEVAVDIGRERLLPRLSISAKRTQGADAREQWGVFETVRQRSQGFDTLRDVGPALPAYERTWQAVREAVQRAKEQRATPAQDAGPRR